MSVIHVKEVRLPGIPQNNHMVRMKLWKTTLCFLLVQHREEIEVRKFLVAPLEALPKIQSGSQSSPQKTAH